MEEEGDGCHGWSKADSNRLEGEKVDVGSSLEDVMLQPRRKRKRKQQRKWTFVGCFRLSACAGEREAEAERLAWAKCESIPRRARE